MPRNTDNKPCGVGGHKRKFCFTYTDISNLLSIKEYKVRRLVKDGKLTPSLQGVVRYVMFNKFVLRDVGMDILREDEEKSKSLNEKVWETD